LIWFIRYFQVFIPVKYFSAGFVLTKSLIMGLITRFFEKLFVVSNRTAIPSKPGGFNNSVSWFKALLESAPDAMVITNADGTIIIINAQTEKLFGFSRNEIIGKKVEILIPERFHNSHTRYREGYIENPRVRGMGVGMELFGRRKDGSEFPVEISLSPLGIKDQDGSNAIAAIRDITLQVESREVIRKLNENLENLVKERTAELENLYKEVNDMNKELESRVKKRTLELEESNKELESFSYSVSHDLRAPLRSIDGFSNKILKNYGHLLDAQGADYFSRVITATQKMGQLIDDLLKLARLSSVEMNIATTDLSNLAESMAMEFKAAYPERAVNFVIQPGLVARADRSLMQIALQNLLGNAWKYTKKNQEAKIEFSSFQRDNNTVYFIRDNGVGFDMHYVNKLFGAFQRLHSAAEFEGTGIGLATVKRIIRRHHGTIWAEGEINQGAVFYFTL
jgi:PAS domain S-box-containing protein